jgi:hypothetical protein
LERNRMKFAFKDQPNRYYAELYCTFPDITAVFQIEWFFLPDITLPKGHSIISYIVWYDPAKRTDTWAVMVAQYRRTETGKPYLQLVEEYWLKGEYIEQKRFLTNLKGRFSDEAYPVITIIDATQAGDVVAEMFGDLIDYKVWYMGSGNRPEVDAYWVWKCPKNLLVSMSQILIEKALMRGYLWLEHLMKETRHFKSYTTQAGNIKYEAETWHDDYVNAMMMLGFFFWFIDGQVYNEAISFDEDKNKRFLSEGVNSDTWLYKPYTERIDGPYRSKIDKWLAEGWQETWYTFI